MKVFIVKINKEEIVEKVQNKQRFVHDDIYNFETEITKDSPVFIYLGGDKSQISWEQGLKAVGKITKPPFDKGYASNPRYFKIEIEPLHVLDHAISPKESKIHPFLAGALYDVPYIGANHFPNQAIAKTDATESTNALMKLYQEKTTDDLSSVWQTLSLTGVSTISLIKIGSLQELVSSFCKVAMEAKINYSHQQITRFLSALCTKPFVILTGLSGSGKTKLAEAFALWISEVSVVKNRFKIGQKIESDRVTYEITNADAISVTLTQIDTRKKVNLPYELIKEWVTTIEKKQFTEETPARTIREAVAENTEYSTQLNSFESHLKACAFELIRQPKRSKCNYVILSVGADWTNREPLLGYPNALEEWRYVKPENGVIDLIIEAGNNPREAFFLILDEMNLSHVERYFADFLSAMELGDAGGITLHTGDSSWDGIPPTIKLPKNLFIIGTVNIDETTYMFSPKVLDRANVIEFRVSSEDMSGFLENPAKPDMSKLAAAGASMAADFVALAASEVKEFSDKDIINAELVNFFKELKRIGAEFGYRTASEIYRFAGLLDRLTAVGEKWKTDDIIDAAVIQKLLPKVHGSRSKLDPVLKALATLCLADKSEASMLLKEPWDFDSIPIDKIRFPLSLEKIIRMRRRVIQDGFTSFAEA